LAQLSAHTNYATGAISLSAFSFELFYALLQLRILLSSGQPIHKTGIIGTRSGRGYWRSVVADLWRRWRTVAKSQIGRLDRGSVGYAAVVKSPGPMRYAATLPKMMRGARSMNRHAGLFGLAGTRMLVRS
jgi:hypothetical protein